MKDLRNNLLVVDDDPAILNMVGRLAGNDFTVIAAANGDEAIEILSQQEVDILLTDQLMPGKSGVEVLEYVREHSPNTIRLMMTGLARLEDAVDAINCGQVHRYIFKPWRPAELLQILKTAARTIALERSHEQLLQELRQLNQNLEKRVQQRTWELEQANRQLQNKNSMLEKLALTDPLTGIPNRRAIDRLARSEQRRRSRYPSPFALGMVDADHFRSINSRYLLPGGDHVLIALAQTLSDSVRAVDSIGRIGGEEFMVVAPETNAQGAAILAERIRSAVEQKEISYKGQAIRVTVSVGFAVAEAHHLGTYDQLKLTAARAMSEAKASGRNCCIIQGVESSGDLPTGEVGVEEPPSDWVV